MKRRTITARKRAKKPTLTKLEKQLANALYRTWEMLPFDLHLLSTEWDGPEGLSGDEREAARMEFVSKMNDSAGRALGAAGRAGWKVPKPLS